MFLDAVRRVARVLFARYGAHRREDTTTLKTPRGTETGVPQVWFLNLGLGLGDSQETKLEQN